MSTFRHVEVERSVCCGAVVLIGATLVASVACYRSQLFNRRPFMQPMAMMYARRAAVLAATGEVAVPHGTDAAAPAAGEHDKEADAVAAELIEYLAMPNSPRVRRDIAASLRGELGEGENAVIRNVLNAFGRSNDDAKARVCYALRRCGFRSRLGLTILADAVSSDRPRVYREALTTIRGTEAYCEAARYVVNGPTPRNGDALLLVLSCFSDESALLLDYMRQRPNVLSMIHSREYAHNRTLYRILTLEESTSQLLRKHILHSGELPPMDAVRLQQHTLLGALQAKSRTESAYERHFLSACRRALGEKPTVEIPLPASGDFKPARRSHLERRITIDNSAVYSKGEGFAFTLITGSIGDMAGSHPEHAEMFVDNRMDPLSDFGYDARTGVFWALCGMRAVYDETVPGGPVGTRDLRVRFRCEGSGTADGVLWYDMPHVSVLLRMDSVPADR